MGSLDRIAHVMQFMRTWEPTVANWRPENLLLWLAWFDDDSRLLLEVENGQLVGAMTIRCLWEPEDNEDPYIHEEQGQTIWVDWVVARSPLTFPKLMRQLHYRLGDRHTVAFTRLRDGSPRIHTYPFESWKRRFEKWAVNHKNHRHLT